MGTLLSMMLRMKKLLTQPKNRLVLLLTMLFGLLVLNLARIPVQNQNDDENVAYLPESNNKRLAMRGLYGKHVGRGKWEPSGEDIFVEISTAAPTEVPVQEPDPPAPITPTPAPEPVAPLLPFVAMAKFKIGEKSTLYLRAGHNTIPVSEGDLIGNGDYKIESISESMVSIRYLPMNYLHELSLGDLE
jgi:hypothetical protein